MLNPLTRVLLIGAVVAIGLLVVLLSWGSTSATDSDEAREAVVQGGMVGAAGNEKGASSAMGSRESDASGSSDTILLAQRTAPAAARVNPIDGQRAFGYLTAICDLGRRVSGSEGMLQQQALVEEHFTRLGARVTRQSFYAPDPRGGPNVRMTNLIAEWHPERQNRILLCAHYDTRPFPDRDPDPLQARRGIFLGANDGASGTALLMELGHHIADLETNYGLDFVLFDGEEYVFEEGDDYFIGSTWFAEQYANSPPPHRYRWGVLLDMVGDADLQIYQERHSAVLWPDTRPLVNQIWSTAQRLGVREFISRVRHTVQDDHLPLHDIARIPTCDIIDFDYPHWHTTRDVPENCSGESLAKVGWVVHEWLSNVR